MIRILIYVDKPYPDYTYEAWVMFEKKNNWKVIFSKNNIDIETRSYKSFNEAQRASNCWITQ